MKKYGYIYKTTHLRSGQYYIGQRKGSYDSDYLGSGTRIRNMVKKYGKSEFSLEVLAWAYDHDQLNKLEEQYVGKLYKEDPMCVNLIAGGIHGFMSEEVKEKISKNRSGIPAWNKGVEWSEERKEKFSKTRTGEKRSEETKKKLSEAQKSRYENPEERKKMSRIKTKEEKQKISESTKKRYQNEEERKRHSEIMKLWWAKRREIV